MPISNSLRPVAFLFMLFVVVAAVPSFAAGKSTSLSDARSAIEGNLKTPEGKAFEDRMGKNSSPSTWTRCANVKPHRAET